MGAEPPGASRSCVQSGSPVSVASAAVQMAQRIFGSLAGRRVLLVGAGETARLAANHLAGQGVIDWRVANRTEANAQVVADLLKAFLDASGYRAALLQAGQTRAAQNVAKLLDEGEVHISLLDHFC